MLKWTKNPYPFLKIYHYKTSSNYRFLIKSEIYKTFSEMGEKT
ncbi:Unannotated [Lentimonas sp. CC4]|nr:Unannotated [Lentimonas sp. CC4]CAA6686340.1 Unannotated [Lentimonas sp. CC6]CAA7076115.1 Unannotated [Lentimonas sp. CC4]CAA7170892.1 Unannotated [Lentimonas sp. CC21]CAA7181166.1 Unannotated [Lentimonas sp. CC8]